MKFIITAALAILSAPVARAQTVHLSVAADGADIVRTLWNAIPAARRYYDDQAKILRLVGPPGEIVFVLPAGATLDENAQTYVDLGRVINGERPAGAKASINFGANRVIVRWAQAVKHVARGDDELRDASGRVDVEKVRREGRRLVEEGARARAQRRQVLRELRGTAYGAVNSGHPTLREWKERRLTAGFDAGPFLESTSLPTAAPDFRELALLNAVDAARARAVGLIAAYGAPAADEDELAAVLRDLVTRAATERASALDAARAYVPDYFNAPSLRLAPEGSAGRAPRHNPYFAFTWAGVLDVEQNVRRNVERLRARGLLSEPTFAVILADDGAVPAGYRDRVRDELALRLVVGLVRGEFAPKSVMWRGDDRAVFDLLVHARARLNCDGALSGGVDL